LKNPEYYTIWNIRRRLLVNGLFQGATASSQAEGPAIAADTGTPLQRDDHAEVILDLIRKDLDFLVPLLRKWPKCYWIWNYRVWLLQEATARLEATTARRLWADEFKLVSMMLVKDNRNFHGWRYRRIIVAELESASLGGTSMVEAEYEYTTKMIKSNLSNFSAWHNRSCLIPRLLNERGADMVARRKMLDDGISNLNRSNHTMIF
jgi:geranylgeranyl transferase type-2 subunit alpha